MRGALNELQAMISQRYPTTTFEISRGQDEPGNVHLKAVVDLDDADEVLDLVSERLLELQVEERIPVHVIPPRTPERVLAAMKSQAGIGVRHRSRAVPLLGDTEQLSR